MRIYGTFDGFKNYREAPNKFKWKNVVNEIGEKVNGIYLSEKDLLFGNLKLKFGNRYMLTYETLDGSDLLNVSKMDLVNKNPRCDIFRRYKDEYHIISGKYKGKSSEDLSDYELWVYCLWLANNTINEATITNTLTILKTIKKKEENE